MEARYRKACVGYARLREEIVCINYQIVAQIVSVYGCCCQMQQCIFLGLNLQIEQKRREGVENPRVTRLDTWTRARTNADDEITDPASLRILEDVVIAYFPCSH